VATRAKSSAGYISTLALVVGNRRLTSRWVWWPRPTQWCNGVSAAAGMLHRGARCSIGGGAEASSRTAMYEASIAPHDCTGTRRLQLYSTAEVRVNLVQQGTY
jgi:hypothetical protein